MLGGDALGNAVGETFGEGAEEDEAVGGAEGGLDSALGVGHEAEDVAVAVADAGDGVERAIGIGLGIVCSGVAAVGMHVVKNNLVVALEIGERGGVAEIISFHVGDGHFQDLARARGAGEGRVGAFDADVDLAAEEAESLIAHHGAGEQAGFEEDLETVADAEDEAAGAGEAVNGFHYRGEAGDGAGAEVVAESEAAGEDDDVGGGEIFGLVPDEFDGLVEDRGDGVEGVVVAVGAGETDYAEFHFCELLGGDFNIDREYECGGADEGDL